MFDDPGVIGILNLEDVISFNNPTTAPPAGNTYSDCRFRTHVSELNSLAMKRHQNATEVGHCDKILANGTWDSIIAYGKMNDLDREQQMAYEILAATYVLSFYEEADAMGVNPELKKYHSTQTKKLLRLARRNQRTGQYLDGEPLRMFVTGPAGAGKC